MIPAPVTIERKSMKTILFRVHGIPKAQPRPRAFFNKHIGQARVYEAGTAEGWKGAVAMAAKSSMSDAPLEGPLSVSIAFYFPRPKKHFRANGCLRDDAPRWHMQKPDRDNCEKAVLDALTQIGMWGDDGQVCDGLVQKFWSDDGKPGALIVIEAATEDIGPDEHAHSDTLFAEEAR